MQYVFRANMRAHMCSQSSCALSRVLWQALIRTKFQDERLQLTLLTAIVALAEQNADHAGCSPQFLNPSVPECLCLPIHRHPSCQTASRASWKRAAAASFWETSRRSCSISAFCCRISSGSVIWRTPTVQTASFRTSRQNHWNHLESSWACRLTSADCSIPSDFKRSTSSLHFWSSWITKSSEAHLLQIRWVSLRHVESLELCRVMTIVFSWFQNSFWEQFAQIVFGKHPPQHAARSSRVALLLSLVAGQLQSGIAHVPSTGDASCNQIHPWEAWVTWGSLEREQK